MNILKKKIVIFSHYATTGACEELRDWLIRNKAARFVYVAFPFGSNKNGFIQVDSYSNGALLKSDHSLFKFKIPEPLSYIKDFLYALFYTFKYARNSDVLICGDNLLSLAAVMVRPFASVKNVVYYMIDYTPVRYKNRLLNKIYYCVDRLAAHKADSVWSLTKEMIEARFAAGHLNRDEVSWFEAPYGCRTHELSELRVNRKTVVYMGDIVRDKGAELFVPMMIALKKLVPDATMIVIGGGEDLDKLKQEISEAGLESSFVVSGFVESFDDVIKSLLSGTVAIAPYYPHDSNNFTFYSDPGKIKTYLGCALPIVITDVPPIAKRLAENGAGVITEYDAEDLAGKVASIMLNENYLKMRQSASKMGCESEWNIVFKNAFSHLKG